MKKFTLIVLFLLASISIIKAQCSTTANYTYSYKGCSTIEFVDSSSSSVNYQLVKWSWDFGDGSTATGQTVTHTFQPGITTNVKLVVTADSSGVTCQDSIVKTLVIHSLPTVYVASNPNPSCLTVPANFFGSSGHPIVSWQWDFGDGTSDTVQNPVHQFSDTGNYNVVLHVIDSLGCGNQNSPAYNQRVNLPPSVSFTWDINPAATTDNIQFSGTGQGNVTSWHWDFGDGDTSNIQNPTHQFVAVGNYQVKLSIVVDGTCTNSVTKTVSIQPLPVPDFSISPVCLNDTTFFKDLSTTTNGYIKTWKWYFGDGDSIIVNRPGNPDVKHIYLHQTTYQVTLLVIDSAGYKRSISKNIAVHLKPQANFTYNDTCYSKPTSFFDRSLTNNGSAVNSWKWNFNDPASGVDDTSSLQNPTHVLSSPGSYSVRLIIGNADGCSDTAVHVVKIDSLPAVDFTIKKDSVCFGEKSYFFGIGNNIMKWHWDFGNGDTSNFQKPVYTYKKPGNYQVKLTVTNLKGCQNSISYPVKIFALPKSKFMVSLTCIGDSTYFTDGSSDTDGYVDQWHWDFGDGDTSNLQNPSHHYVNINSFNVRQVVVNNYGCSDTSFQFVNVHDRPKPAFIYQQACNPASQVTFKDQSVQGSGKSPIKSYLWTFYENDTSQQQNPVYKFRAFDTCYQVTLKVVDTNGCANIDTTKVCLRDSLRIDFSAKKVCFRQPTPFQTNYIPSNDSITTYTWSFNDGSSGRITYKDTINHIFYRPGTFNVKLSAVDTNGCNATAAHQVTVDSLPVPDFSFTTTACDGATYFTDHSTGGGNFLRSWNWNFGDAVSGAGNVSTLRNPNHLYGPQDSVYFASLVVTNFNSCHNSITKAIPRESCLKVNYKSVTGRDCALDSVCFTDRSVLHSNNGSILRWHWDFGDGKTTAYTIKKNKICHTYQSGGTYIVRLTVTAKENNVIFSKFYDSTVVVRPRPVADFSFSGVCFGSNTKFLDKSADNGEAITRWHWNFGDSGGLSDTSELQNPVYSFSRPDTFNVKLLITNRFRCDDSITKKVRITKPPKADFYTGISCAGYSIQFTDTTQTFGTNLVSWDWKFSDPYNVHDTSTVQNPVYKYDSVGSYPVRLIVADNRACTDTIIKDVAVHSVPKAGFNMLYGYQQVTGQVKMENTTIGASTYFWDFGNGKTSTEKNPVNKYESGSIYNIILIATSKYMCSDTATKVYDLTLGLYIPNSFAPASKVPGTNIFQPKGIHLKEYRIQVFSSWGTLLWESNKLSPEGEPTEGWDGTYKGQPMPEGNYLWKVSAKFIDNTYWEGSDNGDGNLKPFGTVTLIR